MNLIWDECQPGRWKARHWIFNLTVSDKGYSIHAFDELMVSAVNDLGQENNKVLSAKRLLDSMKQSVAILEGNP